MKSKNKFSKSLLALVLAVCMILQMGVTLVSAQDGSGSASTTIGDLTVEYTTNPIGIDVDSIHFGWKMFDETTRGKSQQAYRVMVASSKANLEAGSYDMMDTGRVNSAESVGISYEGEPLQAATRYFWKVTVWDEANNEITSTEEAYFETSLLDSGWGEAKWIGKTTEEENQITKYTVDVDIQIVSDSAGFAFGAKGSGDFFMWQVNTFDFRADNAVYLRPHIKQGNSWVVLPASSNGKGPEVNITDAVGYTGSELIGKTIHMKIAVDNGVIDTYFNGSETSVLHYDFGKVIPAGKILFRQNTDQNATEIAKYDNIVVKDGDGNVLFEEDFSDATNPSFNGGTIEDGMLKVGKTTGGENIVFQNDAAVKGNSAPMLRKEFETNAERKVTDARLYASAAGLYEMYLNGEKVGKDYFNPGYTDYMKRTMYQTFDVTGMVKDGGNALSAMLGKGWYCGNITHVGPNRFGTEPALLARLVITYDDGSKEEIVTDNSWKYSGDGPIVDNNFLDGEKYDATKEMPGWDEVNFDETGWTNASVTTPKNIGPLEAQTGETVQQVATLNVVSDPTEPKENAFIYNFGQNFAGVVSLNLPGEFTKANPGLKISLRHGEMLNDDSGTGDDVEGSLYDENLRTFKAIDTYTIRGDENGEVYTPRFTFHGFQYLEITGIDEPLPKEWVTGIVLSNALETTGDFNTSSDMINQLYSNVIWGQLSNFISIPTDCPQRNERMGWTGDAQIFARTATYNSNANQFYTKYLGDVRSSQRSDGAISNVAPALNVYESYYNNGWGDAVTIIPWQVYQQYGDVQVIRDNYDAMKAWIDCLKNNTIAGTLLRPDQGLGDWLAPVTTPQGITDTAFFAHSAELFSKMAAVVGNDADAQTYGTLAEDIKAQWRAKYQNEDGSLNVQTQTAYLVALEFEMLKEEDRAVVAKQLADDIKAHDYHLTVGFVGVSYLCPILTQEGYNDVAYKLLEQETYPSWLYSIKQGATTIWERWNSYTKENGFGPVDMNSFNHYSFGSIAEWMFRDILGIERNEDAPGYKAFILQPTFGGSLTSADGYYDSSYGTIESSWVLAGNDYAYNATVPANTTATLYLPAENGAAVYESGKDITKEAVDGITFVGYENGKAVFNLVSGSYAFSTSVVNKTDLQKAVDNARTYGSFFYTEESYAPFAEVRAKAESYLTDPTVTNEQIAAVIAELEEAIGNLVHIPQQGTESDPILIGSVEDLQKFAEAVNEGTTFKDKFVKLTADLDLSGINWTPIGIASSITSGTGFAGTFDGNRHVISNLTLADTTAYATFGLFGTVTGTVKNLGIENVDIKCGSADCRAGGLIGTLIGGSVTDCYTANVTVDANNRVGAGFIGQNYNGTVENSFTRNVKIIRAGRSATFVSDNADDNKNNKGTINNCYADGSITSGNSGTVNNSRTVTAAELKDGTVVALLNGDRDAVWEQGENNPIFAEVVIPSVDKTALENAIAAAAAYEGKESDYTPDSWKAFEDALAAANDVNNDPAATQDAVNAAAEALNEAIVGLTETEPPVPVDTNKTILKKVYDYATEAKAGSEYAGAIGSVKASFDAAYEEAGRVYADETATQEEVDSAWMNLMKEIHKLGFQAGDKKQLELLLFEADKIDLSKYVEAGQAEFTAAVEKAENCYNDADALQGDVEEAVEALLEAMLNLRFKADKSVLANALAKASLIDTAAYTVESVQNFNAAQAAAEATMNNEALSRDDQAQVNKAAADLNEAINNLVPKAAVQGDAGMQTGGSSAKTGDTTPIAVAFAAITLAGACLLIKKRNR